MYQTVIERVLGAGKVYVCVCTCVCMHVSQNKGDLGIFPGWHVEEVPLGEDMEKFEIQYKKFKVLEQNPKEQSS